MLALGLVLGLVLVLGLGRGRGLRIVEGRGLRGRQSEGSAPRQRVHDEVEPLEAVDRVRQRARDARVVGEEEAEQPRQLAQLAAPKTQVDVTR